MAQSFSRQENSEFGCPMRSVVRRRREVQAVKQRRRCGTYEARAPALYSDPRDRALIVCWHRPIEKRYHALDHDARTATRRSMLGLWGPSTTLGRELHKCHI